MDAAATMTTKVGGDGCGGGRGAVTRRPKVGAGDREEGVVLVGRGDGMCATDGWGRGRRWENAAGVR